MKKLSSLLFLIWLCLAIPFAAQAKDKTGKGPILSGQVVDTDGHPVAGAVVTDGFTQSRTDAEGKFSFESPSPYRVRFVSVCIPSDYLPVIKNGVPTFFDEVPEYKGRERKAKITLVKRTEKSDDFKMMMIADPQSHVFDPTSKSSSTAYDGTEVWKDIWEDMRGYMADNPGNYYGMCLGDIEAWGPSAKSPLPCVYPEYCKGIATLGIPFFNVIGNHDHFPQGESDDESAEMFETYFGPRNYSFDLGQTHCVVLDDCIYIKDFRRYPFKYGLEDEFVEWLKGDLALVAKDTPVMIFTHVNCFTKEGVQNWIYDDLPCAYNLDAFLAALQGFDKLYVWDGHTHTYSFVGEVGGDNPSKIEEFVIGRATGQDRTNEYMMGDGTPRGYVVMEVSGKDISWKFHVKQVEKAPFRGKEKSAFKWKSTEDNQLRAYPRGAYGDNRVYANVFLWDDKWELPVLRIGDKTYPMTRDDCFDLSYKELVCAYKDAGISQTYSGRRAHTFRVDVPADASGMGAVEVTDRFGRTWTTSVSVDPMNYDDGLLHLDFDFKTQPSGCPAEKGQNISFSALSGDAAYHFTLSSGRYVAPDPSKARDGHVAIADRGNYLALPAIPGYKLVSVAITPDGNLQGKMVAMLTTASGTVVSGGEKVGFHGNTTDTWTLEDTKEGTSYRIVNNANAFRIADLRLTYTPAR